MTQADYDKFVALCKLSYKRIYKPTFIKNNEERRFYIDLDEYISMMHEAFVYCINRGTPGYLSTKIKNMTYDFFRKNRNKVDILDEDFIEDIADDAEESKFDMHKTIDESKYNDKQKAILHAVADGNSLRSASNVTGIPLRTVNRQLSKIKHINSHRRVYKPRTVDAKYICKELRYTLGTHKDPHFLKLIKAINEPKPRINSWGDEAWRGSEWNDRIEQAIIDLDRYIKKYKLKIKPEDYIVTIS
jgi:hypothetical protein